MVANALLLSLFAAARHRFLSHGRAEVPSPLSRVPFPRVRLGTRRLFRVLFLNIFAGAFVLIRKSFLKDTGRKLSHIDKQFHVGNVNLPADSDYDERT